MPALITCLPVSTSPFFPQLKGDLGNFIPQKLYETVSCQLAVVQRLQTPLLKYRSAQPHS
jgi:hypothetical protein